MTTDQFRPGAAAGSGPVPIPPLGRVGDRLMFLAEALRTFRSTGALAPSGEGLVNALVVPVTSRPDRPLSVLEVGAGTGAVTRRLARVLRPGDRLHVVEANPRFVRRLREDPDLGRLGPRIGLRLSACRLEELPECRPQAPNGGGPPGERYDVIVSGLPLTNFEPAEVRHVLDLYLRLLVPGGELTYFGYLGTTAARTLVAGPRRGARHRAVVRLLRRFEAVHGLGNRTVWRNLPPARAQLLRAPGGSALSHGPGCSEEAGRPKGPRPADAPGRPEGSDSSAGGAAAAAR
ncbi:class I SAM-dependent methyltransferase [Kitasatospora sp. NPDC048239]|uniref:class I SAM-dependent methyltransferase n=1 Tax=Kitasatospora sp. NPDC048239 TaxID=3364046 RepID=UPI00371103E9